MNQTNTTQNPTPHSLKQDEHILVVKRSDFFVEEPAWSGLKEANFDTYLRIIQEKKDFLPRSQMEVDPGYKQIIPYLIFTHNDKLFLMQRTAQATESRLQNKYSLGIGGHIRQEDLASGSLFEWARREFNEEVEYNDEFSIEPLGILNDDSNAVGTVHVGFVFLLKGTTDAIKIKSELKSGILLTLEECKAFYNTMESWSQMALDFIVNRVE